MDRSMEGYGAYRKIIINQKRTTKKCVQKTIYIKICESREIGSVT